MGALARGLWVSCVIGLLGGCKATDYGYAVRVTIDAPTAVTDDTLAQVRTLEVTISGAESGTQSLSLTRFSTQRQERFLYRPTVAGGLVTVRVVAADDKGLALAAGAGSVELEPGKTVALDLTLGGDVGLPVVTPATPAIGRNATLAFKASLPVHWSIAESGAGTIDSGGSYIAPAEPGIYHVVATAADDPTRATTITVTVGFNQVSLVAGASGGDGYLDGTGKDARFSLKPRDSTIATGPNGSLYIADRSNSLIRKIDAASGAVTTVAGLWRKAGGSDGPPATFAGAWGLAIDQAGSTLYVSDADGHTIRKVDLTATPPKVTTLAGAAGNAGFVDSADGKVARFHTPLGLALDEARGQLYVADFQNCRVRSIAVATGATTTLAGDGTCASVNSTPGPVRFGGPSCLAYDGTTLFVTDQSTGVVRKVALAPLTVTTMAGTAGTLGNTDGTGTAALLSLPMGIASMGGSLLVTDRNNNNVRVIDKTSLVVRTIAGPLNGATTAGYADGAGAAAQFRGPSGIAVVGDDAFVLDTNNGTVRKVAGALGSSPTTSSFAGLPYAGGTVDGDGAVARVDWAQSMVATATSGEVYFGDWNNNTVRRIMLTPSGSSVSAALSTVAGQAHQPSANDGVGTAAGIGAVHSFVFDGKQTLYLADYSNESIRALDVPTGRVTTLVRNVPHPRDLAFDGASTLYFTQDQSTISMVTLPSGAPTVRWGLPAQAGFLDGNGTNARLNTPTGLVYDPAGILWVADSGNNAIRKVDLMTGELTTAANQSGQPGSDDGAALHASFAVPFHLQRTPHGQLLIGDHENSTVRIFNVQTNEVATVLGNAGMRGARPGPVSTASLSVPEGLALLPTGELLVGSLAEAVIQLAF